MYSLLQYDGITYLFTVTIVNSATPADKEAVSRDFYLAILFIKSTNWHICVKVKISFQPPHPESGQISKYPNQRICPIIEPHRLTKGRVSLAQEINKIEVDMDKIKWYGFKTMGNYVGDITNKQKKYQMEWHKPTHDSWCQIHGPQQLNKMVRFFLQPIQPRG